MKKFFRVLLVVSFFVGCAGISGNASAWSLEGDYYDDSGKCVITAHNGYVNGLKVMGDYMDDELEPGVHVLKLMQPYGISFMRVQSMEQGSIICVDDGPALTIHKTK